MSKTCHPGPEDQNKKLQSHLINFNDGAPFALCDKCGNSMVGDTVPKSQKKYYGRLTHFSRWISLAKDKVLPLLTTHLKCPDCGHEISLFKDEETKP